MKITERDARLRRIAALGKAGGAALVGDPNRAVDTLQRRCSELQDAVNSLYDHVFQGPIFGSTGNLFRIDARPTSAGYNLLTAAQANVEVGLNAPGVAIFRHGLGYALDFAVVVSFSLANPLTFDEALGTTAAALQPERVGGLRWYAFDNHRTVFQLDTEAVAQQAVVWLSCFSSRQIPSNQVSPVATGAARIANPLVLAASEGTTVA